MPLNPVCLPGIRRQQWQAHEPMLTSLTQVSRRFELFRFGGELVQSFGMHQRMALVAHQGSGGEFLGTAFAIANEFGSECGHGFEERRLNSTGSSTQFYAKLNLFYLNLNATVAASR
jgi:hypothetical protein